MPKFSSINVAYTCGFFGRSEYQMSLFGKNKDQELRLPKKLIHPQISEIFNLLKSKNPSF